MEEREYPWAWKEETACWMHVSIEVIISRGSCSCQLVLVSACFDSRIGGMWGGIWEGLPWLGIYLLEFYLVRSDGFAGLVKDEEAGTCGSLVD